MESIIKTTIKNLSIAILIGLVSINAIADRPNIILFGLPGAGKGTLSQKLIEKDSYAHVCPGNLLRAEVRNQTNFGKQIESILARGDYVPEEQTFAFLKTHIMEAHSKNLPIIFDGYPRSVEAIRFLDNLLNGLKIKENTIVLHLKIDKEKLMDRVLNRAVCNKCNRVYTKRCNTHCNTCGTKLDKRPQDTAGILKKRINHYENIAGPLLAGFKERGYQIVEIQVGKDSEQVFNHAYKLLHKKNENQITFNQR